MLIYIASWIVNFLYKKTAFLSFVKPRVGLFKKVPLLCPAEPKPCIPHFLRDGVRDVIPRRASAEGPLASLGATKKGLGVTKNRLGATAGGLAQKHFEYSLSPVWAVAVN